MVEEPTVQSFEVVDELNDQQFCGEGKCVCKKCGRPMR